MENLTGWLENFTGWLESLTGWLSTDLSLWALFLSSFFGATLLPGGSELVLIGVLKLHPETWWPALMIATLGNTLGGMVTFGMGMLLPQTQQPKHSKILNRYGSPALLLAWLPLIGDALCMTAGWLRLNFWVALFFIALGKFTRYFVIALSIHYTS